MWTGETRRRHDRSGLRHTHDLTDGEWDEIAPLIPPARRGGKKRHILAGTTGLMMHALVHAAGIQDRDGGVVVMAALSGLYPFLLKLYAGGGYQGPVFQKAMKRVMAGVTAGIVRRSDQAKGFAVLPRRWVVERTFAWLNRCRRLARDRECLNRRARAWILLASIRLMLRRLGKQRI